MFDTRFLPEARAILGGYIVRETSSDRIHDVCQPSAPHTASRTNRFKEQSEHRVDSQCFTAQSTFRAQGGFQTSYCIVYLSREMI